jgi:hypothetical protein
MQKSVLRSVLVAAVVLAAHAQAASGPLTEAEIKKSIETAFTETYVDPVVWKITKIRCDFGPIKVGSQTQKQVQWGKAAEPVWPVKVVVKVTEYRGDAAYKTITRGEKSDDIFFFYKDAFGEWKFKTGSL